MKLSLTSKLVLIALLVLMALSMVACDPDGIGGGVGDTMTRSNPVNSLVTDAYCAANDGSDSNLPNIYGEKNVCK